MANRAYLYASDSDEDYDWDRLDDRDYFDSRWTIPLAWWLLFAPSDLKFVNVRIGSSTYEVLRFISERTVAIDRFKSNQRIFDSLIHGHVQPRQVEYFVRVLSSWPGRYLFMSPDEILDEAPEVDAATILPVLNDLQLGLVSAADMLVRLKRFSAIESGDRAIVLAFGYNYGPIGKKVCDEMDGVV